MTPFVTLYINNNILQAYENGEAGSTVYLESTVKHELTHYFDKQDGWIYFGEAGEEFEIHVYGENIDYLPQASIWEESYLGCL